MIKVDSELSRNKDYFSKIYKDFSDKKYICTVAKKKRQIFLVECYFVKTATVRL